MEDLLHQFRHEDIEGAVIRVLDDEVLSVNEFLAEVHQLDDGDEYEFAYTCCYLKYRDRPILVDAGFDPDTTPGALESIDIFPEDIEIVLLTHADRDHVAGLLMHDGSLTYPNAQHVIGKELWENLTGPETLDALDEERSRFYRKLIRALDDSIQLCDGETEVADGIRFIPSPGHRIGHAVYQFATEGTPLVHTGDSFFHPLFAEHPDWANVTDSIPVAGVDSRRLLVARIAESNAMFLSTHSPFPGIGQLKKIDDLLYEWTSIEIDD
ncbi:MBL fold metallo-hydrolase [Candidatus Bipolaricaulota bacterium]|nr:MBL fold metallo-hydrolase [Candidatus Bipolaricaulota bacterium]